MEPLRKPITVNDLSGLTHALQNWSSKGLQTFLESGLTSDIREALKDPEFDFHKALIFSSGLSTKVQWADNPPPTFAQFQKLLSQAPTEDRHAWSSFCALVKQLSFSIYWWESTASTWEKRDEFREVMGLKTLNLRIANRDGLEIIFRCAGHCTPWKKPPTGYRYASLKEVQDVLFPQGDDRFKMLVVNDDNVWWTVTQDGAKNRLFPEASLPHVFHQYVFFVPLVKIKV